MLLLSTLLLSTSVFASAEIYCPDKIVFDHNGKSNVTAPFYIAFGPAVPKPYIEYIFYTAHFDGMPTCQYRENPSNQNGDILLYSQGVSLTADFNYKNEPYGNKWYYVGASGAWCDKGAQASQCPWMKY